MDAHNGHEDCCKTAAEGLKCPLCGATGRKVGALTLDHQLDGPKRAKLGETAGFCPTPACAAVYFSGEIVIRESETRWPVTQKDPGDDVNVCYCFDFKRSDIRRDLAKRGSTNIPDQIRKGIAEGRCDCERKNPQGVCCLGNVSAVVKAIQSEVVRKGRKAIGGGKGKR